MRHVFDSLGNDASVDLRPFSHCIVGFQLWSALPFHNLSWCSFLCRTLFAQYSFGGAPEWVGGRVCPWRACREKELPTHVQGWCCQWNTRGKEEQECSRVGPNLAIFHISVCNEESGSSISLKPDDPFSIMVEEGSQPESHSQSFSFS